MGSSPRSSRPGFVDETPVSTEVERWFHDYQYLHGIRRLLTIRSAVSGTCTHLRTHEDEVHSGDRYMHVRTRQATSCTNKCFRQTCWHIFYKSPKILREIIKDDLSKKERHNEFPKKYKYENNRRMFS
jgi:hypothetical protein